MQTHFPYPEDSAIYHDFANVTRVFIDRDGERIVLPFDIEIAPDTWGQTFDENRLRRLLLRCYGRAVKLDIERKYNRHFCSLIRPFNSLLKNPQATAGRG